MFNAQSSRGGPYTSSREYCPLPFWEWLDTNLAATCVQKLFFPHDVNAISAGEGVSTPLDLTEDTCTINPISGCCSVFFDLSVGQVETKETQMQEFKHSSNGIDQILCRTGQQGAAEYDWEGIKALSGHPRFPFKKALSITMSLARAQPPPPPTKLGVYRVLSSRAGVHVSPLCLGALSIGDKWNSFLGSMDKEASLKLLDAYFDMGGNFIDTASN
ncbi:putative aryl-alcohol dehydrogenase aad14 [Marasmius tenuissimus]|uniref:Aryl-alcohol dehydrogenase aad14 n=1 Tax=Marasmius tenuissimus TaxID=585030 RepID=A0ABR2ZI43_9AGAR